MTDKNCTLCTFYAPQDGNLGQCRVRAPAIGFVTLHSADSKLLSPKFEPHRVTSFPIVQGAECWCGEFRMAAPVRGAKKAA